MEKPTILIIDDEEMLLSSFATFLESDFNVLTAPNGKEGLSKFRSNTSLSLILLDLCMPVMNGVETLKAIREVDDKINVVVMTGNSSHAWAAQCADLNVQGYIQKPLEPDEIIARLKKLILCHEDNLFHNLWGDNYQDRLDSINPLVMKAIKLVDRKFASPMRRDDIALKLNVSPDHLSKTFRQECGFHLSRYITERRIHESKKLLAKEERVPIAEVARLVGVSDVHYFSRQFKKHTGSSPKAYMKKTRFPNPSYHKA